MAKIGIDFGTSYSTVSYVNPKTGEALPIRVNGKEKIPTILFFPEDGGDPFVGDAAYAKYEACQYAQTSDETDIILSGIISDLKRNMSKTENIAIPGMKSISYAEAIAIFFKYLKDYAERTCFENEQITDVCITYPVVFDETPYKKDILKEAANLAGFNSIKLLKEPVAAAMGYSKNKGIKNQGILIYDFGGGTFDIAYVKFDHNGEYITFPPIGDANCGGENIDYALYETWDKMIKSSHGRNISEFTGEIHLPILKQDCMKQKEAMSQGIFQKHILFLPPCASDFVRLNPLSQNAWIDIISPWIEKTIMLTRQMLTQIENEKNLGFKVDKVILIGGSSKLPTIPERLSEICPVAPMPIQDVDVAVANGAAIYANMDNIYANDCYCIYCGSKISTRHKMCMFCGKPNFRYNYCFDDI